MIRAGILPFIDPLERDRALDLVRAQLSRDGLIAYPTETVYGFGSSMAEGALARLSALKPRDAAKPFLLLIADAAMADDLVTLPTAARALAAAWWPGPLTLVLRPRRLAPPMLLGPRGGLAVRWTSHTGVQRLIRSWGAPITSTSANRTGLPTASTAQEIAREWREEIEAGELVVLDGGPSDGATPSTVVDCIDDVPRLVREGAIRASDLRATVSELVGEW